jgi:arylformamidase
MTDGRSETARPWRRMDRVELDRQYDARGTVGDILPFLQEYARLSSFSREQTSCLRDVIYDRPSGRALDYFPAGEGAPLFVFFHGGYWRLLSKDDSAFMALNFVAHGISVAAVDYDLAPGVSLDEIVRQARRSVEFLFGEAQEFGIDRTRIFVGGSSAGAHLAAMTLATGRYPGPPVAGGILASGLYELEPLRHCRPNDWLRLDARSARRNSPIHHLPNVGPPLLVAWAGTDTEEFKRQSRDFAAAWRRAGHFCATLEIADRNHFDSILDLAAPDRSFSQAALELIRAGQPSGAAGG